MANYVDGATTYTMSACMHEHALGGKCNCPTFVDNHIFNVYSPRSFFAFCVMERHVVSFMNGAHGRQTGGGIEHRLKPWCLYTDSRNSQRSVWSKWRCDHACKADKMPRTKPVGNLLHFVLIKSHFDGAVFLISCPIRGRRRAHARVTLINWQC